MMQIAGILPNSLSNGKGCRLTIFFSGCSHKCKGCHNEHLWNRNVGKEMKISEIVDYINKNKNMIDGVTLTGGEPFEQAYYAAIVAMIAKEEGLNVWTYTGYKYQDLVDMYDNDINTLLYNTDVLVDGKYKEELKDETSAYRGSTNQRIISLINGIAIEQ